MEGINILATNVIRNGNIAAGFVSIIGAVIILAEIMWGLKETKCRTLLFCIIFVVFFAWFGVSLIVDKTTVTQYKVIVSDGVSLNLFNDKYRIISQEGKIYTVEEKPEQ